MHVFLCILIISIDYQAQLRTDQYASGLWIRQYEYKHHH